MVELDGHERLLGARDDLGDLHVLEHVVLLAVGRAQFELRVGQAVEKDVHLVRVS